MLNKEFLYFVCDDAGNTYGISADGNVVTTPGPYALRYTPIGWRDSAILYKRNAANSGVVRTSTTPFGFVKDGAKILRYLWYNYGIEAVGNLAMAKLDPHDLKHKKYYFGALNFTQATDGKDKIECEVTEGGLSMMIKANENTKYEIDLDVPEALDLRHDGMIIKSNAAYAIQEGDSIGNFTLLGCLFINTEGTFTDIVFNTTFNFIADNINNPPVSADSVDYLIRNDGPTQTFNLHFKYSVKRASSPGLYTIFFHKSNGTSWVEHTIPFFQDLELNEVLNLDIQVPVTLQQGERLFVTVGNAGVAGIFTYFPGGTLDISFDFRFRETTIKCLRPLYVFQKLIEKITDGKYTASSTLLETVAKDFVLTCGDGIRSLPGAKIKTSLKDFFTSFNTRFCIGLGNQNEVAVIEAKGSFYTSSTITDLGEVADCQVENATDYLWNTLKIGWPAQDYDDVNGKDEFNNTHIYTSPVKRLGKELDLTAPYRCDPYGIEFTRQNLAGKSTTDNDSDNDVFIINIADNGSGGYILNRPAFSAISGVRAGSSIFNTELRPTLCVLANGPFLAVGMDKLETGFLAFQTTEKNATFSTTLDGVTLIENQNFLISSLGAKLFLPKVFNIDCRTPDNIVDLIEADPYGVVRFKWLGNAYAGHIMEAGQQAATNAKQAYKLLASIGNDMLKLIH